MLHVVQNPLRVAYNNRIYGHDIHLRDSHKEQENEQLVEFLNSRFLYDKCQGLAKLNDIIFKDHAQFEVDQTKFDGD